MLLPDVFFLAVGLLSAPSGLLALEHGSALIWAQRAFSWLEDQALHSSPAHNTRVYLALPTPKGRLVAVSADGGSRLSGRHDAVLVLDGEPNKRFAHPITIFFIDLLYSKAQCDSVGGQLLEGGDCLQMGTRRRCDRRSAGLSQCHRIMLYLPEVRLAGSGRGDRLQCVPLPGFHQRCPQLRPHPLLTSDQLCGLHNPNSKSCDTTTYLRTDCPFMQTCDHAVLLAGGWNRQMADDSCLQNILDVNVVLQKNGFMKENIKIFFANGLNSSELKNPEIFQELYSSGLKLGLRYHLRTLCETSQCSDTLLIYMNSPTRYDGSTLLWDSDGNGEFDETEIYTVREFLRDIQSCSSRRVVVIADQNYSSELVKAASHHRQLQNVLIIASDPKEPMRLDELTRKFVENFNETTCISKLTHLNLDQQSSNFIGGWPLLLNTTLSGAPCINIDQMSNERLKTKYFGCQNLSTLDMLEPDRTDYQNETDDMN